MYLNHSTLPPCLLVTELSYSVLRDLGHPPGLGEDATMTQASREAMRELFAGYMVCTLLERETYTFVGTKNIGKLHSLAGLYPVLPGVEVQSRVKASTAVLIMDAVLPGGWLSSVRVLRRSPIRAEL